MRIMYDTNILISLMFFDSESFLRMHKYITENHTLVLSSMVVEELQAVAERKFPEKARAANRFLERTSYELVLTPRKMTGDLFKIRDMSDYPVLYTAVTNNIDVFITGDKDFGNVSVKSPEILTPGEFAKKYMAATN